MYLAFLEKSHNNTKRIPTKLALDLLTQIVHDRSYRNFKTADLSKIFSKRTKPPKENLI